MLTQESQASAPASIIPPGAYQRVRISRVTPAGAATVVTAALGALGLVWLLYEQMLAFSGVLCFWLSWYVVFVLLYAWMAWHQWGRREATDKVAVVAVTTAGLLSPLATGGVLHAIAGTLEQIALGTLFAVPLGLLAALFLAEVGGPDAQPIRVIVEAMTALPDVIAGLFIYALAILCRTGTSQATSRSCRSRR